MAEQGAGGPPEAEEYADAPMVFQCAQCQRVVADSFAMAELVEELGCVPFSAVTEAVVMGDQLSSTTNRSDIDFGCSYMPLTCVCGCELGKVYQATVPEFDCLRNLYTVDVSRVTTYNLGTSVASPRHNVLKTFSTIQEYREKISEVIVSLSERIHTLEMAHQREEEDKKQALKVAAPLPKQEDDKKHVPKHNTPLPKQERSRVQPHKTQNGYRSPPPNFSRSHRRKKQRIAYSDSESD